MSKQLKKQIAELTKQVAAIKVANNAPSTSKKKRNRRKKKGRRPGNVGADGKLTISRWELLTEIKAAKNGSTANFYKKILPQSDCMSWLYGLAKNFSRITWHSLVVEYRPAVGATKDGCVTVGVDWKPDTTVTPSKTTVQNCTPNFQVPVWQRKTLTVPSAKLQTRKEYLLDSTNVEDNAPGDILAYLNCTSQTSEQYFGDIWVHYNVSLFGPK